MANRTATLNIRITKNGRSSFCKPVYQSKGRLKPQYAMIKGEPEHHKEGVYYVRLGTDGGKQPFVLVGKDPRLGTLRFAAGHSLRFFFQSTTSIKFPPAPPMGGES